MQNKVILETGIDDRIESGITRIEKKLKTLGKGMEKGEKKTNKLGKALKLAFVGSTVHRSVGLLTRAIRESVTEILAFEHVMKQIQGITGKTESELATISSTTRRLGLDTEFSTSTVAKAVLQFSKMGFSVKESNSMISTSMDLVTASGANEADVFRTIGMTMKIFERDASNAARVSDILQTTVSQTANEFEDISEAFKHSAPIAHTMSVTIEELSAAAGILGNLGLKGSIGGTALKNMLTNLVAPSTKAKAALDKLGIIDGSLIDILQQLGDAGASVGDLSAIFNLRALPAAAGLSIKSLGEDVRELTTDLANSAGKVKEVAEVIRSSIQSQMKMFGSNVQQVGINLLAMGSDADGSGSMLEIFNDKMRDFNKWLQTNPQTLKDFVDTVVAMGKAFANAVGFLADTLAYLIDIIPQVTALGVVILTIEGLILGVGSTAGVATIAVTGLGKAIALAFASNPVTAFISVLLVAALAVNEFFERMNSKTENSNKIFSDMTITGLERQKKLYTEMSKIGADQAHKQYQNLASGNDSIKVLKEEGKVAKQAYEDWAKESNIHKKTVEQFYVYKELKGKKYLDVIATQMAVERALYNNNFLLKKRISEREEKLAPNTIIEIGDGDGGDGGDGGGGGGKPPRAPRVPRVAKPVRAGDLFDMDSFVAFYRLQTKLQEEMSGTIDVYKTYTTKIDILNASAKALMESESQDYLTSDEYTSRLNKIASAKEQLLASTKEDLKLRMEAGQTSYTKTWGDSYISVRKTNEVAKEYLSTLKKVGATEQELAIAKKGQEAIKRAGIQRNMDATVSIFHQSSQIMSQIADTALTGIQEQHDKKMSLLQEEHASVVAIAGSNVQAKIMADQRLAKETAKLEAKKMSDEKKYKKLKKASAISDVWVNTAVGVSQVWSQFAGIPALAAILSALTIGMGVAQTASITAQKYAFGKDSRMATGNGGTSDLVPAMISPNEYIISSAETSQLGGFGAVSQLISDSLVGASSSNRGDTYIFNGTVVGEKEYVRQLMSDQKREGNRWSQ